MGHQTSSISAFEEEIRRLSFEIIDVNRELAAGGYRLALASQRANLAERLAALASDVLPAGHRRGIIGGLTIADTVVEVLEKGPAEGMELKAIRTELNARTDRSIARTSISPALTKLAEHGIVLKNGRLWQIRRTRT